MKKGIRYLRFSSDGQSQHSIERQDFTTNHWMQYNKVSIVDTFTDEGYTARNFDRPDIKALFEFIKKNFRGIDYMVVAELTRFSREAGDAINMVKKIQMQYGIRIVSAGRGAIYDCLDHNSFFMMGLEFLLGNSENIKRTNDINGGIYTAKAVKGKWIQGGAAPFGYTKQGTGDDRRLVINEDQAVIIRYIFNAYLANTPVYIIRERIKDKGFTKTGNGAIQDILNNPLYAGYQHVKAYKDQPGGLHEIKNSEPIIDVDQWNKAQALLKSPEKPRVTVEDDIPLRGVLHCHCHKLLTGAASRGRHGKYYYYYKCQTSSHNNVSATFAHNQLNEALKYLSLPDRIAIAIKHNSEKLLNERMIETRKLLQKRKSEFDQVMEQIQSVESKFINDKINSETYHRWHSDLSTKRITVRAEIEKLSKDENNAYFLLSENLMRLTDLHGVYHDAATVQKQQLLRMVFDNGLYYKDRVYRTPFLMPVFQHNSLILKQKQLLVLDSTGEGIRSGGGQQPSIEPLLDLLSLVGLIRVA